METRLWKKWMGCAGAMALALAMAPGASALCGLPNTISPTSKPMAWQLRDGKGMGQPSLLRTAFEGDDRGEPSIVGMWHVVFTAYTQNGEALPSAGVPLDNSVVVWNSDGTEIMNSSRAAQDGNFCLGVWECTGRRTYLLNHIPWQGNVFDPTASPSSVGAPQDGGQIVEKITLSPDGNSYSGTFTFKVYDTSGSVYLSFTGKLAAKRITPTTPFSALL